MRTFRIFLCMLALTPVSSFAASGMLDAASTVDQLTLLIRQYETRIKQLESENSVLKNEMVKANIKIPLTDFSGAVATPLPTKTITGGTVPTPTPQSPVKSDTTRFIERITMDWTAIQKAYSLPSSSRIAGYEFVQSGALDHVFVDLVYTTAAGTGGVYDAKILYQYEKNEYKRKLIGFFVYDPKIEKYITKTGANPFGGVARSFVRDPNFSWTVTPPPTASSGSVAPVVSPSTTGSATIVDISKAYSEKRYLTTISLANTFLTTDPNNIEVLGILYRTYFITSKFDQSLSILAKIEALGKLDRTTACNAYAIAKYAQNASLTTKYSDICYKK